MRRKQDKHKHEQMLSFDDNNCYLSFYLAKLTMVFISVAFVFLTIYMFFICMIMCIQYILCIKSLVFEQLIFFSLPPTKLGFVME